MGIRVFGHVFFDGIDLADFGITLSGTGTFNAPDRDVTKVSVPGRDGDLLFDNGRYNNIQVTYPVNIELGLPGKVHALRAFLLSHKGYFRLEDSYHPDEFRLAQYAGPFEIEPTGSHNRYGRMNLVFDCKPQRFLKSGEREIELNITDNPTPGTEWDARSDLDQTGQEQAEALGLSGIFPVFDLPRDTSFVYLKSPHNKYSWIYPNNHLLTTGRYDISTYASSLYEGTIYHATVEASPFLSVWDDQGEIYTPSYFGTEIYNPTRFPASPLIKIYLDPDVPIYNNHFDTSFGCDAENYVSFNMYLINNNIGDLVLSTGTIIIDCETYNAYSADVTGEGLVNFNPAATFGGQILLPPGKSTFRVSNMRSELNHATKVTITPRWWRL